MVSRRRAGDEVVPFVRPKGTADALFLNPGSGTLDPALVSGFDTVIHLAGEPVVGIWTSAKRRRILDSRVLGTAEFATALASAVLPPRLFLCASGINFYGNRGNTELDEAAPSGQGFLAEVSKASRLLAVAHIQIKNRSPPDWRRPRFSGWSPATASAAFSHRLGSGRCNGEGYVSWIALEDLVRAIDHLIETSIGDGPINLVLLNQ